MYADYQPRGFAAVLDRHGVLREFVFDGLGAAHHVDRGALFMAFCDLGSRGDCRRFIDAAATEGGATGWELVVILCGQAATLHFAGIGQGSDVLVVGSHTPEGASLLFERLLLDRARPASTARELVGAVAGC